MTPEMTPITGKEDISDLSQPSAALAQFYRAFNTGDFEMMKDNWLQTQEAALDNPLGGIMRGWDNIQTIYEKIFNGPAEVYVEYYEYTIHETGDIFYAVGRERGSVKIGDGAVDLAIRTSRIYRRIDGVWKQVHHHGSIDDPQLLDRYQKLVTGKK